ncbi:50S ribosomal protein L18a [Candidatus Bathyarchaeota archaeon]|nr:MAG: 50S ribosomal protein L18a [Candidatus Bathyarchaeota archaeon]
MSTVKIFRVIGEIRKPNLKTRFRKEIPAVKPEHAVEKVYTDLGSKHRIKRYHIKIIKVEEVPLSEVEDPLLRKMFGEESIVKKS